MYGRHGRGLRRLVTTLLLAQQLLACTGWRARRSIAALLLAFYVTACVSYRGTTLAPASEGQQRHTRCLDGVFVMCPRAGCRM
jgi:hypothetical protein